MRPIHITLVLAVAVAASVTLVRQRQPERRPDPDAPDGLQALLDAERQSDLDAIRAAGF